ncbi:hypothetical protein PsorP6_006382 [Peronosclerospora sorghi]|uniref:Uncharacterized protein n=1 Tax=Peronosclerospora sorghi TaxID=230839 RepID=A0ACC0W615_9STRA|nr:hypothetical protein PsorP6_006382 [Peronosclerospora sorghi]
MNVIYSVKDYVSNVFHQESGSGAVDVVAVQQPDGSLQCSPFHVHFGSFHKLKQAEKQQVLLEVNGHVIPSVHMEVDNNGKAYFIQHGTSSLPSPPSSIGDVDDFIHRRSFGKEDAKVDLNEEEDAPQRHVNWQPGAIPSQDEDKLRQIVKCGSIYFDAVDLRATVESDQEEAAYYDHLLMSLCGHLLADARTNEDMDRIFSDHLVTFEDFRRNAASLLAHPHLRFFVNGKISAYNAEMQAYLVSRVMFPYSPHLPINTSRDTNSEEKSTTLWGCSDDGRLTEDTASIRSELDDHKRLKPNHDELVAMDLHVGMNELVFVLQSQDPVEEVARVTATLYVWPVHAKVVIAHMDGAIISCATTGRMFKRRGPDAMHLGALDFYAKLAQNGYHVVYVTCHGLAQATVLRTRFRSNVRDTGEASLPMGPVLHSHERLLSTASLEDAQDVNMTALDAVRSLFPRCVNPFYASFSTTQAASRVFTQMGVFAGKVFMVDPHDGSLRHQSMGGFRESYTSLLDRMDRMFPPISSFTCTEHEAVRNSCSTASRASLEDEHLVSEPVRLNGCSQDFADEAYNDVNFWRIEPLRV